MVKYLKSEQAPTPKSGDNSLSLSCGEPSRQVPQTHCLRGPVRLYLDMGINEYHDIMCYGMMWSVLLSENIDHVSFWSSKELFFV
jgi:hypothetical protein